jgi:hypothetical protein
MPVQLQICLPVVLEISCLDPRRSRSGCQWHHTHLDGCAHDCIGDVGQQAVYQLIPAGGCGLDAASALLVLLDWGYSARLAGCGPGCGGEGSLQVVVFSRLL